MPCTLKRTLTATALRALTSFIVLCCCGVVPLVTLFGLPGGPVTFGALALALLASAATIGMRRRAGRPLPQRWRREGAVAAAVTLVSVGTLALWLPVPWTVAGLRATVQERLLGETPEARVNAYARAVLRGDEAAALGAWTLPEGELGEGRWQALRERRTDVTQALLGAGLERAYAIGHIEWWVTCCEPGITDQPRGAGGARVRVEFLDRDGLPQAYVFDVLHRDGPYWGAALGYPVRRWALYDVYPAGEAPLYWRFVHEPPVRWLAWPPEAAAP